MKKYISTLSIFLFCISLATAVNAQKLNLNKGDEYKVTTVMSTNMQMKRGDKQADYKYMSSITKAYNVTDANDNGYNLAITTKHIADTIDAFNQKLAYSTDRAADANSSIETALSKMVGETQTLSLDKSGKITQVGDMAKASLHAQVAGVAGVYNKSLVNGSFLNFGATFNLPTDAKKGTKWNETTTKGTSTEKTTYTVESVTATTTKVAVKSEQSMPGSNTNLNGILIVDNATGVVLQRIVKLNTLSNESTADGKKYMVSRLNTISEVITKVK